MEHPAANANDDSVSLVDEVPPPSASCSPPHSPPPLVVLNGLAMTSTMAMAVMMANVDGGNGRNNGRR